MKEANENINSEQINYFTGFLDIINTKIKEMMIPLDKVYKLDYNFNLNHNSLNEMIEKGYSRIPIYENIPNNLKGVLLLKDLIGKDLTHPIALNELNINLLNAIYVNEETFYIDLFEKFKNGKSKMAFVYKEIKKEEKLIPDDLSTAINDNEAKEEKEEKEEKIQVKESMKKDNKNKNKDEEALMPSINDEENNEKIEVEEPLINSINDDENVEKIKVKEPLIPKENKEEKEKEEKNKVEENKKILENNEKIKDEEALIPDGNDEDINENIKIDEAIIPNNKDESKKNKNKKKKEIKEDIIDIEGIKNKNDDDLDNSEKEIIGIITLEDLIESLLKIHFKDEREIIRKPMRKMTL